MGQDQWNEAPDYATHRAEPGILEDARPDASPEHGACITVAAARSVALLSMLAVAILVIVAIVVLLRRERRAAADGRSRPESEFLASIDALAHDGAGVTDRAEARLETAAINRTLAYTPWVRIAGAQHREIALTFDDGPGPYTPQILAVLQRAHVPATFFEVGILERYFHASTTAIAADGDVIGDHTEVHAADVEAVGRRSAVPAARAGERDRALRGAASLGCSGRPTDCGTRPPWRSCTGTGC